MAHPLTDPLATDPLVAPVTVEEFSAVAVMRELGAEMPASGAVAVAVSGGPDSMALLALTQAWARPRGVRVYALTIDHALRAESAAEAAQVGAWIAQHFPGVCHEIIRRDVTALSATKLQEQARADRYRLMAAACARWGVAHLLLAHHRDDQAETFLMRLCKGSGLDGLAGMKPRAARDALQLLRPLLSFDKAQLVACCAAQGVPYVCDPSNGNEKFARARLRGLRAVLTREGLSVPRLAATAMRMGRARTALEFYAAQAWEAALINPPPGSAAALAEVAAEGAAEAAVLPAGALAFDLGVLRACPEDIRVRVLMRALVQVGGAGEGYGPRLEQVEALAQRIFVPPALGESDGGESDARESDQGSGAFVRTTLHQCIIERSAARGRLLIRAEGT